MRVYSDVTKKFYDTVNECEKAEADYQEQLKNEASKKDEKKELAHKVEDSYKEYLKVVEEEAKKLEEARSIYQKNTKQAKENYFKARNEFIKKYGSFHMTYKGDQPVVDTIEYNYSLLDDVFDAFRNFPRLF